MSGVRAVIFQSLPNHLQCGEINPRILRCWTFTVPSRVNVDLMMIPRTFIREVRLVKSPEAPSVEETKESLTETESVSTRSTQNSKRLDELYEHGKTLRERRRSMQEDSFDPKTYTFKPKILEHSRRRRSSSGSQSTFVKLYEDAEDLRQRHQQKAEAISKLETPTFTPITSRHQVPTKIVLAENEKQKRFKKLYEDGLERQEKNDILSATYTPVECTFEPKTNSESSKQGYSEERLDELYEAGRRKYLDREEAKLELEQQFSFTPRINSAFMSKSGLKPSVSLQKCASKLHPSKEELARRQLELETRRKEKEMQGCTFAPRTNPRKGKAERQEKAYLRLYKHAKDLREKKEDLVQKFTEHIVKRASVSSINSTRSVHGGMLGENNQSFSSATSKESVFERLYENGVTKLQGLANNEEIAKIRRKEEEWQQNKPECTFTPKISDVAKSLNSDRTAMDSFTRLYMDAELRKDKLDYQTRTKQGLSLQCTFHPKINEHSKALADKSLSSPKSTGETYHNIWSTSSSSTEEFTEVPSINYKLPSPKAVVRSRSPSNTQLHRVDFVRPAKDAAVHLPDPIPIPVPYDQEGPNESKAALDGDEPRGPEPTVSKTRTEEEAERMRQLAAIFVDDEI